MIKIKNRHISIIGTKIHYMDGKCLKSYLLEILNRLKKHLNSNLHDKEIQA